MRPAWLDDDRFWYRMTKADGSAEFVIVDAAKGERTSSDKLPESDAWPRRRRAAGAPGPRDDRKCCRRTGSARRSSATRTCGCATSRRGKETPLTTDGVKDFGYATDNAGWTKSDRPILLWSPDSKKIATFQHDGRKVGEMYLVDTRVGHPRLQAWKYPLPGDEHIFMIQRVIIS